MSPKKNLILGMLILSFCIGGAIWGILRRNNLEKKHEVGNAVITGFYAGGRGNSGGIWIDCVIYLNGKNYTSSSRYLTSDISSDDISKYILHKSFPVVYSPSNPSVASLMITPKDFARYGYSFPDSLNWVMQYFSK